MRGEELLLQAARKELKRLERIAQKAADALQESDNVADELIEVNREFEQIVESREVSADVVKKLEALQERRDRAFEVLGQDYVALLNKKDDADLDCSALLSEIRAIEFRQAARKGNR